MNIVIELSLYSIFLAKLLSLTRQHLVNTSVDTTPSIPHKGQKVRLNMSFLSLTYRCDCSLPKRVGNGDVRDAPAGEQFCQVEVVPPHNPPPLPSAPPPNIADVPLYPSMNSPME